MKLIEELHYKYTHRPAFERPKYVKPNEFCLEDALEMFKSTPISEECIQRSFPMSKQVFTHENDNEGIIIYQKLSWSEYMEFLCRVAFLHFANSEMEGLDLDMKMRYFFDDVFTTCIGQPRAETPVPDIDTCSDEDY